MKLKKKELTIEQMERRAQAIIKFIKIITCITVLYILILIALIVNMKITGKQLIVMYGPSILFVFIVILITDSISSRLEWEISIKKKQEKVSKIKKAIVDGKKNSIKVINLEIIESFISRGIRNIKTIETLDDKIKVEIVLRDGSCIPANISKKAFNSAIESKLKDEMFEKLIKDIKIEDSEKGTMTINIIPTFEGDVYTTHLTDNNLLEVFELKE